MTHPSSAKVKNEWSYTSILPYTMVYTATTFLICRMQCAQFLE